MKLKKIWFMGKKLVTDVMANAEPYKISEDLHSEKLGEFYFLFEEDPAKLNKLINDFDENGIPVNSSYIDVENPKPHYYPISIGQYGLAVFNTFIRTGSEEKKTHFLRIADWFYENKTEDELGCYWLTDIPKPEYKVIKAWKSAFTQSRAVSILLRAWQITGEQKYFDCSKKALSIFSVNYSDNGVSFVNPKWNFYEEYVAEKPTMVLDGHIFSMLGIYDFMRVSKNFDKEGYQKASGLFDKGINGLLVNLPEYDLGFWLKFNLCKMDHYPKIDPCTIGYLRLVVLQLKLLAKITGNKELDNYYNKFKEYDRLFNIFRMYPLKYKALKKLNRI